MQYVRSFSGSVSKTWNSINPATLSGAIDVIVVEQEDGSLACSPFHIRFGKFSLLRPYEKKVEFRVNDVKQEYPMKLGEGGEAFFVFETAGSVPEALQTSPLVSPAQSPEMRPEDLTGSAAVTPSLQEPDPFELEGGGDGTDGKSRETRKSGSDGNGIQIPLLGPRAQSDARRLPRLSTSPNERFQRPLSRDWSGHNPRFPPKLQRASTDNNLAALKAEMTKSLERSEAIPQQRPTSPLRIRTDRSTSPPLINNEEAKSRAIALSKKLWTSNIPSKITDEGDLMLDMTGYKSSEDEALRAEVIARKILSEELEGPYDIGALIGADEHGNLWIYSSEEAKEAAGRKAAEGMGAYHPIAYGSPDAISDPGYASDDARSDTKTDYSNTHIRRDSDSAVCLPSQPNSPNQTTATGDPNRNYAKTLRLTSDQLKTMNLKSGENKMSFSVNRATCTCSMWYWKHDVPIVISDIDGTITKSDVLGHVLTTIGRDWTHLGVAKLYTEIVNNGYNIFYLTSRSVGQADSTRAYLAGVVQEGGFRLPNGPTIMSPDRTIAALRREIYLRKPEVFKMACLRDIMTLFSGSGGSTNTTASAADAGLHTPISVSSARHSPFYAGFGNRLTDALSYRSVNIPSTRIFTINSNAEVSLDLLSLNMYKTGYASMREIVDHYFPPVGLLVKGGGEEFTDFNYWREKPLDLDDFSGSESGDDDDNIPANTLTTVPTKISDLSEDEGADDGMLESYLSDNPRESLEASVLDESNVESIEGEDEELTNYILQEDEDAGDVGDDEEDEELDDDDLTPDPFVERRIGEERTPRRPSELQTDLRDLA